MLVDFLRSHMIYIEEAVETLTFSTETTFVYYIFYPCFPVIWFSFVYILLDGNFQGLLGDETKEKNLMCSLPLNYD